MNTFDPELVRQQARDKTVISFDVFDTLLIRTSTDPRAVLHLVETIHGFRGFAELRMACEQQARQAASASGREDTTLEEIYRVLLSKGGKGYQDAKRIECELESALLRPNPEMCELLVELHRNGKRIIATSDMYHDSAFVEQLLSGLGLPVEKIFVSSETGYLKASGNMFRYVLEQLGVQAHELLHIGDNWLADVKGARSAGVAAIFYPGISVQASASPLIPDLIREFPAERVFACLAAGQAHYRWLMQDKPTSKEGLPWWIGYCLLGPLSRLFVEWLYRQARSQGVNHLYLLRRDGELCLRLLQSHYPGIGCELIYGNRKLLQDADLEQLLEVEAFPTDHAIAFRISHGDSLQNIAKDLDFSEELLLALKGDPLVNRQWQQVPVSERPGLFLAFIKRHSELWRSYALKRRAALKNYYDEKGVTPERHDHIALVDIGWRLSSFRSLGSLLGFEPRGFFFGIARGAFFGRQLKGFIFDYGAPVDAFAMYKPHFIEVIETLFGGCEPTAISITGDGQIVLDQIDDCERARIEFTRACYEGAMAFNADLSDNVDYLGTMPDGELADTARELAARMVNTPSPAFFDALSGLHFSAYAGKSRMTRKPLKVAWQQALDAASPAVGNGSYDRLQPELLTAWSDRYTRSLLPAGLFRLLSRHRIKQIVRLIERSGLFDSDWYLSHYPEANDAKTGPAEHYVRAGVYKGFNPSRNFDSHGYLADNPDVARAGMNPLLHYIQHGQYELRMLD